jgi:hypothetical protein
MKRVQATALALIFAVLWSSPVYAQTILTGVWQVQEISVGGESLVSTATESGLVFFGNRHYSGTYVNATRSRRPQDLPRPGLSYEAVIALYEPFSASAGEYELAGSTLRVRPTVAAIGSRYISDDLTTSEYQLDGDRLVLTTVNDDGVVIVRTLVRVE